MLVAISGSQGVGKSTIITELAKHHHTIKRKTSRSILDEWGVSLSEVNSNPELTIKFQETILERKWKDELEAISSPHLYFTERTHIDLFTYALVALGSNNEYSDWLNSYFKKCIAYSSGYHAVFYIGSGIFPIDRDDVRGHNNHYSRMVDVTMRDITSTYMHDKMHSITSITIRERIKSINNILLGLQ